MVTHSDAGDSWDRYHDVMVELSRAWGLFSSAPDAEHWEVANAQLTATLAVAQAVVRDEKRHWGLPLHSPDFCLPWLVSPPARRPRWVNAS